MTLLETVLLIGIALGLFAAVLKVLEGIAARVHKNDELLDYAVNEAEIPCWNCRPTNKTTVRKTRDVSYVYSGTDLKSTGTAIRTYNESFRFSKVI